MTCTKVAGNVSKILLPKMILTFLHKKNLWIQRKAYFSSLLSWFFNHEQALLTCTWRSWAISWTQVMVKPAVIPPLIFVHVQESNSVLELAARCPTQRSLPCQIDDSCIKHTTSILRLLIAFWLVSHGLGTNYAIIHDLYLERVMANLRSFTGPRRKSRENEVHVWMQFICDGNASRLIRGFIEVPRKWWT